LKYPDASLVPSGRIFTRPIPLTPKRAVTIVFRL
jgi:hypothetical protein